MSHTSQHKAPLLARVRRLKGQLDAIERALEADAPCAEILNLAASVRGATNGLVVELLEDHLHSHVVEAETDDARKTAASDLVDVMRRHLK